MPDAFGRYETLAEVGDGSTARVYRAWDPAFQRVVAVKTVKTEYLHGPSAAAYLRRFRREARAAGAISHPNVVRVFDIGPDFLVMEFVEGRTLRELLRERRRFSPRDTTRLLAPIADAIDQSHGCGIVHRDVKPANIMVRPDGSPKLMDFGIAHLEMSVMTGAGELLGSPSYMAPERLAAQPVAPSWDVWALAVVAYELVTGRLPFEGPIGQVIRKVIREESRPPCRWNAGLPAWYDSVFSRALHKQPERRYATAVDFLAALDPGRFEQAPTLLVRRPATVSVPAGHPGGGASCDWRTAATVPLGRLHAVGRPWKRAFALGVTSGLLLGLTASPVEHAHGAVLPSTESPRLLANARARAQLTSGPGIGALAMIAPQIALDDTGPAADLARPRRPPLTSRHTRRPAR